MGDPVVLHRLSQQGTPPEPLASRTLPRAHRLSLRADIRNIHNLPDYEQKVSKARIDEVRPEGPRYTLSGWWCVPHPTEARTVSAK